MRWSCAACGKGGQVLVQNAAAPSKAVRMAVVAHLMRDNCAAMLPAHALTDAGIVFNPEKKGGDAHG